MTPEGKVKARINKLLQYHGCYSFMPVKRTAFGKKTLDYLVCAYGHFIAIEAKAPGKKPTALQETYIREIQAAGGHTFVIDGYTIELEQFLESASKCQAQATGSALLGANPKFIPGGQTLEQVRVSPARSVKLIPSA